MSEKYGGKDVEIYVESGKYCIDGRSIMGIFSLNITAPMLITINSKDVEDIVEIEAFLEKLKAE